MTAALILEQAIEQMRIEFVDSSRERLDALEARIYSAASGDSDLPLEIFREVHNLKGSGATYGLQSVSLIAHQFEDYLSAVSSIDDRFLGDIAKYIDALRSVVASGEDRGSEHLSEVLRGLPVANNVDLEVEAPLEIKILLVSPSRSARQILARDLRACGYGVMSVETPWKALQMSVCARPDMVITSVVMDGVDLANALGAIAATQDTPVAVLTSFESDHPLLERLSAGTPVIRSGKHFQGDLADALAASGLT